MRKNETHKLVVVYNERVISIPFKNIALIDEFTIGYSDMQDIGKTLNEILDLRIEKPYVKKLYIVKTTKKDDNEKEYTQYLPIKYKYDNFDSDSVKHAYIDYLIKNREVLYKKNTSLNIVVINYLNKYNKIYIDDQDISIIASAYLGNNYNRYRSAYFMLISIGYKIKNSQEKINFNTNIDRTDLTKYNTEDEYFEYLKEYSTIGEEEKAKVMDILASYTQEELNHNISNSNYSLFDNQNIKRSTEDEALLLQALTNMSIQELINLINNYKTQTRGKRKWHILTNS